MTEAELKSRLADLLKLPAETEWVEFKEVKSTLDYKQVILDLLREFGSASRADIDSLLKGKLSDILTPEQQATKIKNLLYVMARKDRTIKNVGSRTKPDWRLA